MNRIFLVGALAASLAGCAAVPTAPRVAALPGSNKSFEAFQHDDAHCRSYAYRAAGGSAQQQASNEAAADSAALGTVIGAAIGALVNGGHGAAAGGGLGLLTGVAVGSNPSQVRSGSAQQRYDSAYLQCMYMRGNQVPGRYVVRRQPVYPSAAYPPPPPNAPPPPATTLMAPPPDAAIPPPNAPPPPWVR
ncbi:MAG: hypothetical protein RR240_11220 [Burkholderiaceae bacterium]